MQDTLQDKKVFIQTIEADWLSLKNVQLNVLRLDEIHTVISGNKWFKLKYYLQDALAKGYATVTTFGGAYSNHIIATAYACRQWGLKSIGIIRGEEPVELSYTLRTAKEYGMQLHFISRKEYKDKETLSELFKDTYLINEGGYGIQGSMGAKEILLKCKEADQYSQIVCAVGTGTMMAGIIQSVTKKQEIIGISAMKGNTELVSNVKALLNEKDVTKKFTLLHEYHFGGYAKHPAELLVFMNQTWQQHQLPTDIVYTSKTFYAVQQIIMDNTIPAGSKVLMIHSGGLQGNLSLPEGTLCF